MSDPRLSRKAVEPVGEQLNVTPKFAGKEQSKEKAKSEEKQQRNDTSDEELQSTESAVSPGSLLSLDEESLAERAFEEYMTIMDSLCPDKIHENVEVKESEDEDDEDEDGEKEKLETENSIFLKYLDELCSDEDFVRKVESTLDTEFLESLLSSDPDILDFIALETQEQEVT
ncbi:NUT family member 2G-like isoform X2 [Seriola aureovittata]|uniref:NUT family member 2G-like isoform X2 n=1 Tax=Seriola aureovittata TaxID=2871759 RepID=UPI0024BE42AE|nr:NUT family member 2G-like isoform X2 [Seriola aureovittata]